MSILPRVRLDQKMIQYRWLLAPVFAVACLLLAPVQSAVAQPYDDTEARNLATVRAGFDAWRNGTGSPYDALADDATWEIVGNSLASRVYPDKEDFVANVIRPFNARMAAPLRPTIRDIYADGDTVIVFFDAEGIALHPMRGIGLRNMMERMDAIGGRFDIASSADGTVVTAFAGNNS